MDRPPFLEPGRIGGLDVKNQLVRAPTSESMANADGSVTTRSRSSTATWRVAAPA